MGPLTPFRLLPGFRTFVEVYTDSDFGHPGQLCLRVRAGGEMGEMGEMGEVWAIGESGLA